MSDTKKAKELYEAALKCVKKERSEITEDAMKTAFNYCKESADSGYVPAMNLLGIFYSVGYGVTKDDNVALEWFKNGVRKCGWTDVTTYNSDILTLKYNPMFGTTILATDFKTSVSNGVIKDKKMAKLMMDICSHLYGNMDLGGLMLIKTMTNSFCFLDVDETINWIDFEGNISKDAKKIYDNTLPLEDEKENLRKKKLEEEQKRKQVEERKRQQVAKWKNNNLCQHCGNKFKGIFSKKCSVCGIKKDY